MRECKLDHSYADVVNKLESQKSFLPEDLYGWVQHYLKEERTQDLLNELFHLLKKYDLVSEEEQEVRNNRLTMIVNN
ncbi:group-specific protein [Domibacillus sp. A3M-37]|jgi:hypothetical protein|uniref:hypothetical protein n=1 Tax=Domibacillus TaxID=1433999 RepID=UPI000617F642|nr:MULTISPECIES: hypothetical protein [Domibacillus]MCP3763046.1 group-specific protein [Domibacillus sp. A3M-37]